MLNRIFNILSFLFVVSSVSFAQQKTLQTITYKLWSDTKPKYKVDLGEKEFKSDNGVINFCTTPTLKIYLPQGEIKKTVVICPGGGYYHLAYRHEGEYVAEFLSEHGIAAAVLAYRMPGKVHQIPLEDVRQAFSILRENSAELKIDPQNIGIMGFSAGGHLASTASVRLDPAFAILVYPVVSFIKPGGTCVNLTGCEDQSLRTYYSNELHVTSSTPPTLMLHCKDDDVVSINDSYLYYQSLKRNNVSCELIEYDAGGHGWGFNSSFQYSKDVRSTIMKWLNEL